MDELQTQMLVVLSAIVALRRDLELEHVQLELERQEFAAFAATVDRLEGQLRVHNGLIEQLWERLRNVQRWLNSVWSWMTGF